MTRGEEQPHLALHSVVDIHQSSIAASHYTWPNVFKQDAESKQVGFFFTTLCVCGHICVQHVELSEPGQPISVIVTLKDLYGRVDAESEGNSLPN